MNIVRHILDILTQRAVPIVAAMFASRLETLAALQADPEALTQVLLYHVVPGKVMAADVVKVKSATTAQGSDIDVEVADGLEALGGGG